MDGWRRDLQAVGIGMLAATALELAAGAWNTAPSPPPACASASGAR